MPVIECVICRDHKDKVTHKWFTPTSLERRIEYFKGHRISHGYCLSCYIEMTKQEGVSAKEIVELANKDLISEKE
jgi:hypothetical protein